MNTPADNKTPFGWSEAERDRALAVIPTRIKEAIERCPPNETSDEVVALLANMTDEERAAMTAVMPPMNHFPVTLPDGSVGYFDMMRMVAISEHYSVPTDEVTNDPSFLAYMRGDIEIDELLKRVPPK